MKQLSDVLKFSPKNDQEVAFKLVVNYIKSQKAKDEHVLCDKISSWPPEEESATIYRSFWYSHLCGGGCYNHALTFHLPTWDSPHIRISPAINYGLQVRTFTLIDPDAVELKAFVRQIFDMIKKEQNRSPWPNARIDLR
jgi:hypothetical protein